MKVLKNLDKQNGYSNKELINIQKINNQITNLYKEINNLKMKLNQKEDDIKNIINEKDSIIKKMENKLLNQEKIISRNGNEISKLNNKIEEITFKFNSELQDKENKINTIKNKILQLEKNYLNNELMNEEKTFEVEIPLPISESNLYKDKVENNYIYESTVYCILKLNPITLKQIHQNLVAIGFSDNQIMILNLLSMKVYQIIRTSETVYSLCQYDNNPNYLFASLSNGLIMIYELTKDKYDEKQILEKPEEYRYGEINKVITLSNGDLASAERGAISIWKKSIYDTKNYEYYKELKTEEDTCQLIEVNANILACTIYKPKIIKVFKRKDNSYTLIGNFENCHSHGNNSNSMAKINDNLFCSGGNYYIYIVSVEPVELKKIIEADPYGEIKFTYVFHNCLFIGQDSNIIQYMIDNDEESNFMEFNQIKMIKNFRNQKSEAIAIIAKGKIFYESFREGNKRKFILTNY